MKIMQMQLETFKNLNFFMNGPRSIVQLVNYAKEIQAQIDSSTADFINLNETSFLKNIYLVNVVFNFNQKCF